MKAFFVPLLLLFLLPLSSSGQDLQQLRSLLDEAGTSKVEGIYLEDFRVLKKKSGLSKRKLEKWFPLRHQKLFQEESVYTNVSRETTAYTLHLFDSTRVPGNKVLPSFALAWVLYVQPDGQIFAVFYKSRKKDRDHPVFAPAVAGLQQYVQANRRLSLEPGCYFSQCGTQWYEFE